MSDFNQTNPLPPDYQNPFKLREAGKRQKIALGSLLILTILIILLGVWKFNKNLFNPLYGGLSKSDFEKQAVEHNKKLSDQLNQDALNEATKKTKDTDKDGLTDWEEENIYKTSPYLEDTNGDGIDDKTSLDKGVDPVNCPEGSICHQAILDTTNKGSNPSLEAITSTMAPITDNGTVGTDTKTQTLTVEQKEALKNALGENVDATTLRKMMLESGADKATLDQISDEDILKNYKQMLNN